MPVRHNLSFEVPEGVDPMEIVEAISAEHGEDSGYIRMGSEDLKWDLVREGDGVEIDRRQRVAATLLLMAFDLPQEMTKAARTMAEAARVCPGITTGDIGGMGNHNRLRILERARDMVEQLIAEAKS